MSPKKERSIQTVIDAVQTLEGGGFPVRRPIPARSAPDVDPFLLLDEMGPVEWKPGQAIGAPDHPHRGFETVTYMISGRMEHKDSAGHRGVLGPGDVQWMTAGAGVVHSEMPEPEFKKNGGLSHGFQLWVNLPRKDKMIKPQYQELPKNKIPEAQTTDGLVRVRVIAGEALGAKAAIKTRTPIMYLHYSLQKGGQVVQSIPENHNAYVYVFSGKIQWGTDQRKIQQGQMAVLGPGREIRFKAGMENSKPTEILVLSGVPLGEPVARYGPFVMNTREEIDQAIADYQNGRMGSIAAKISNE